MSVDPKDRVREFIGSLQADLDSKNVELARLERERDELQHLIQEVAKLLSGIADGHELPLAVAAIPSEADSDDDSASPSKKPPMTNGLPGDLTRRQVILEIIPGFHGEPFTARDIRRGFVRDYIEEEPPNFPQAINNLLQRMAEKGEIKSLGKQGDKISDPYIYKENENREDTLLESDKDKSDP